jgi:hypothetical protein
MIHRSGRDEGAWRDFFAELDRWPTGAATFWWRDDDAVEPRGRLDRLLALSDLPVSIAAIPANMRLSLVGRLAEARIDVLQHGFSHANHEPPGMDLAELGPARPSGVVLAELARGRDWLAHLFGPRFLPVLVPPWHRIAEPLLETLTDHGYAAISGMGARVRGVPGPLQINGHLDPMNWKPTGWPKRARFRGAKTALGLLTTHLAARRLGQADPDEPTGLITHHAWMDEAAFVFAQELLSRSATHPAVVWRSMRDILREQSERPAAARRAMRAIA